MSDSRPDRDALPDETASRTADRATPPRRIDGIDHGAEPGYSTRTNPHDESGSGETAARTVGLMSGMFLPAIVLAVIALVVILLFVL
jgi:hypothetical protein